MNDCKEGQGESESQFLQLLSIIEGLEQRVAVMEKGYQVLVRSNKVLMTCLQDALDEAEDYKENAYFELCKESEQEELFWYPQIEAGETAIERIVNDRCSMARFGDGEFAAIAGRVRHKFQTEVDEDLRCKLLDVLNSRDQKFLLGIADNYGSLEKYNAQAQREIRRYLKREVRREHLEILSRDKVYYDAYVTRPYVMYKDNQTDAPEKRFENLKRIWNDRDCIFVEGAQTGLGVGNDLFANAKSIQRILAPPTNAFRAYNKILNECLKQKTDKLFLLALGPSASILAYDLYNNGYQAVDIGHVDLEYEWFLKGEGRRTPIDGKYNNEVAEGEHPLEITDAAYLAQIIADYS